MLTLRRAATTMCVSVAFDQPSDLIEHAAHRAHDQHMKECIVAVAVSGVGASIDVEAEPHCCYQRAWPSFLAVSLHEATAQVTTLQFPLGHCTSPKTQCTGTVGWSRMTSLLFTPPSPQSCTGLTGEMSQQRPLRSANHFPLHQRHHHMLTPTQLSHHHPMDHVLLLGQSTSWPWHTTHLKSHKPRFTSLALPPLKDQG